MRLRIRNLDPKARRMMVAGNLSLVIALLLWNFARPAVGANRAWLDGVCGLLMGVSIGMNLTAIRMGRRCGENRV